MKLATLLVLLTGPVALSTPISPFQCDPSDHCPSSSIQCFNCNPRTDPGCASTELADPESNALAGFCAEPIALAKKKSFGMPYHDRCRRIRDPTGGNELPAEQYVRSCRDLEFTCNDGSCEEIPGIPKNCRKKEQGHARCSYDNLDLAAKITELWTNLSQEELDGICADHGGVRYDYLRCDSPWRQSGLASDGECDGDHPNKIDAPVCPDDPTPEINEETAECEEVVLSGSSSACCLVNEDGTPNNNNGLCETLIEFGPSFPSPDVPPTGGTEDQPANGLVLDIDMEQSRSECCCDFVCQCFGDPHCTSYFGAYELTMNDFGSFTMYSHGAFQVDVEQGPPQGIIESADITMSSGDVYIIDADLCTAANNESSVNPLPDGWDFEPGNLPSIPPKYSITDDESGTTTTVICVAFTQNTGPNQGDFSRLDISILKKANLQSQVDGDALCCPDDTVGYDQMLEDGSSGFCMQRIGDPPMLEGSRRLRQRGSNNRNSDQVDPQIEAVCEQLRGKGNPFVNPCYDKDSCIAMEQETMGGSCSKLVMNAACHSFGFDPVFDPANYGECDQGVKFEIKPKNSNNWETIYFFPLHETYCSEQVIINFAHIHGGISLEDYDMRFEKCSPPESCNADFCAPTIDVKNLKVQVTYPCLAAVTSSKLLTYAVNTCAACPTVEAHATCIQACVSEGTCDYECASLLAP